MADTSNSWYMCKENQQPLASGRDIKKIDNSACELSALRASHEEKILHYDGDDRLKNWIAFIDFIEQSYADGGKAGRIVEVISDCVSRFIDDPQYQNDERFLKIVLKHIRRSVDPVEKFTSLFNRKLFVKLALFYVEWSWHVELAGNFKEADNILQKGLDLGAEPPEKLHTAQLQLQNRQTKKVVPDESDDIATSESTSQRKALVGLRPNLKKDKAIASVDRVSTVKSCVIFEEDEEEADSQSALATNVFQVRKRRADSPPLVKLETLPPHSKLYFDINEIYNGGTEYSFEEIRYKKMIKEKNLRESKTKQRKAMEEILQRIADVEARFAEEDDVLGAISNKMDSMEKRVCEKDDTFATIFQKIASIETKFIEKDVELELFSKRIETFESKLSEKVVELESKLSDKTDELKSKLSEKTDELKFKLSEKTDELESKLNKKAVELESVAKEVASFEARSIEKINELEAKLVSVSKTVANFESKAVERDSSTEQLSRRLVQMETAIDEKDGVIQTLESKLSTVVKILQEKKPSNEEVSTMVRNLLNGSYNETQLDNTMATRVPLMPIKDFTIYKDTTTTELTVPQPKDFTIYKDPANETAQVTIKDMTLCKATTHNIEPDTIKDMTIYKDTISEKAPALMKDFTFSKTTTSEIDSASGKDSTFFKDVTTEMGSVPAKETSSFSFFKEKSTDSVSTSKREVILSKEVSIEADPLIRFDTTEIPHRTTKEDTLKNVTDSMSVTLVPAEPNPPEIEKSNIETSKTQNVIKETKEPDEVMKPDFETTKSNIENMVAGLEISESKNRTKESNSKIADPLVEIIEPKLVNREPVIEIKEPNIGVPEPIVEIKEPTVDIKEPLDVIQEPNIEIKDTSIELQEPNYDFLTKEMDLHDPIDMDIEKIGSGHSNENKIPQGKSTVDDGKRKSLLNLRNATKLSIIAENSRESTTTTTHEGNSPGPRMPPPFMPSRSIRTELDLADLSVDPCIHRGSMNFRVSEAFTMWVPNSEDECVPKSCSTPGKTFN